MTRLAQIAAPFGAALALALAASAAHAGDAAQDRDLTMNVSVADLNADRPGDAAQPIDDDLTRTACVSFTDLDLSRPEGRALLERRVETAAQNVCKGNIAMGFEAFQAFRACRAQALIDARPLVARAVARAQTSMQTASR